MTAVTAAVAWITTITTCITSTHSSQTSHSQLVYGSIWHKNWWMNRIPIQKELDKLSSKLRDQHHGQQDYIQIPAIAIYIRQSRETVKFYKFGFKFKNICLPHCQLHIQSATVRIGSLLFVADLPRLQDLSRIPLSLANSVCDKNL